MPGSVGVAGFGFQLSDRCSEYVSNTASLTHGAILERLGIYTGGPLSYYSPFQGLSQLPPQNLPFDLNRPEYRSPSSQVACGNPPLGETRRRRESQERWRKRKCLLRRSSGKLSGDVDSDWGIPKVFRSCEIHPV